MAGAFEGFGVITLLIAAGWFLAVTGVLDAVAQKVLARLVFFVATPALLIDLLQDSDLRAVFGHRLAITAIGVVFAVAAYVPWAVWKRRSRSHVVVGALGASYANAGYLGIPVATFVLGDATFALPIMVFQLVFYAPLALTVLQLDDSKATPLSFVLAAARNPVTVAAVSGVLLAVFGIQLPVVVAEPIHLLGQMAVPAALLAFGVSLRFGPRIGGTHGAEAVFISVIKLLWQPLVTYVVARWVFDLGGAELAGLTVMAALPAAQNVFIYASRFDRGVLLARDVVAMTTLASAPVLLALAATLV